MTKVNLFDIGKAFYQRAYRDPTHAGKAKALRLSDDLWHNEKDERELLGSGPVKPLAFAAPD
jgi:hypothetical protein